MADQAEEVTGELVVPGGGQPLDISPITTAGNSVTFAIAAAPGLTVSDAGSRELAIDLLAQLKEARDAIETRRKELVAPIKKVTTAIDAAAKAQRDPIDQAMATLRERVNAHDTRILRERREAEEARAQADAEAGAISDPGAVDEVAPALVKRTTTAAGSSASSRERLVIRGDDVRLYVEWLTSSKAKRKKNEWPDPTDRDWDYLVFDGHTLREDFKKRPQAEFGPGIEIAPESTLVIGR